MRKRDRRALGSYVREVADLMELHGWHIYLSHDPPGECDDAYAACERIYGQKIVVFRFADGFRDRDIDGQRHTVVYKLVYLHLASLTSQLESEVSEIAEGQIYSIFFEEARLNLEYAVDDLTRVIARHMPLIKWPDQKNKR